MKPNNTPLYVHQESNHPPNILKNIPESINRRLSTISSDETMFNNAAPAYQEALKNSGYKYKLKYDPAPKANNENTNNKRSRKRNITWFNPPYSENVATNIGKKFLFLIDRCFPPGHQLHKLLNRNNVKISYSCMPNMKQIINNHNRTITEKEAPQEPTETNCNCRRGKICPLDKNCLTTGIVYQSIVKRTDTQKEETYIGLTDTTFKTRYNGHTCTFRNPDKRINTTLSQYIWTLKDDNIPHSIKWKTISKSNSYSTASKKCNLCLQEKYYIICKPQIATLNNRNELASECRHRKKHLLSYKKKKRKRRHNDPQDSDPD